MTWPTKKLGEVCEEFSLAKASIDSWPYVEISDINIENKSIIFKEKKSVEGAVIAPKDSVIVSRVRPTRGAITLLDQKQVVSSAFTILKVRDSEALPKFLFYSIGWSKEFFTYLHRKQKGSNYPSVREKHILNFKILSPPLKVQHQIVERMDAIKKAQELNDKQIALAEELFQTLLHQELKPRKDWELKSIKECLRVCQYGISLRMNIQEAGHSILRINNLDNGEINLSDIKYVEICKEEYEKYKLEKGDILFNRVNSYELVGKTSLFNLDGDYVFASYLIRLKTNPKLLLPELLNYYLNSKSGQKAIKMKARRAVSQANVNAKELGSIKIPLPPLEAQRQIVEKLQAVQDYKKKLLEQKQKLKQLFDSCLDKAMKGELVS